MLGYMNIAQSAAPISGNGYYDVPICDSFSNPSSYGHGPYVEDYNVNKIVGNRLNDGHDAYTVIGHPTVPSPSLMYESDQTSRWDMPMNGPNPLLDLSEDRYSNLSKKKELTESFEGSYNYNPQMPPIPSNMAGLHEVKEGFRGGRGGGGGGARMGGGGARMGGGGARMGGGGARRGGGGAGFRRAAGAAALGGAAAGAYAGRRRNGGGRNRPNHHHYGPNYPYNGWWGPSYYGGGGWGGNTYIDVNSIPDAAAFYTTYPGYSYDPYSISSATPDVYIQNYYGDDDYDDTPVVRAVEKKVKESTKKDMMTNLFIIVAIIVLILILYKLVSKRR